MPEDLDQELVGLGITPGWRPPAPPDPSLASIQNPQTYPLTIGGAPLAQGLGFTARAVAVDNRTGQSIFLPDAGRYVQAQTIGQVVRLPNVKRATAVFQTPPNEPTESPVTGQLATLTYYEQPLPETPPIALSSLAKSTSFHASYAVTIPAGGNVEIVFANAAKRMLLLKFHMEYDAIGTAGANVSLIFGSFGFLAAFPAGQLGVRDLNWVDLGGILSSVGDNLVLSNSGALAIGARGFTDYNRTA